MIEEFKQITFNFKEFNPDEKVLSSIYKSFTCSLIMDFFSEEKAKEFEAVGFRNQRKNLKYRSHQIGKSDKKRDEERKALLMGKRVSKTGKIYYEYRKNRGDLRGSNL